MTIREAFEGKRYDVLREWYQLNGGNIMLKMLLDGDMDEYLEERLLDEVEKILPKDETPQQKTVTERMMEEPQMVQDVFNKARYYFKQMKEARVGIFSDDEALRKQAALDVVKFAKLNKECWIDIDHYKRNGYLPSEVTLRDEVAAMSLAEITKQKVLDENYVYKHTKRALGITGKRKENIESEIKRRKERLAFIEKRILTDE